MSSSQYHNSENEGAGPSKKKKIKYNQVFKKSWAEEEQFKKWIKQGKDEYFAMCCMCNIDISIKNTGRLALVRHQDSVLHMKLCKSQKKQGT
ncbi:unnamed protein product [Acanthoscelides obtectus]|uniref:Uncharacterized protein n=1 Tax=Acanthoscelides obtectus TaxID=200917 RepID=A0A9P0PR49_ACAOB|nr:unnamed protein product [Acanthoscelides obtectus]CAK1684207.1 hypothetical protein AOBTE_LOCUS34705 [Acanthoscelides obtectus]